MIRRGIAMTTAFLATLTFFVVQAHGQQRIASVQGFTGDVELEHSAQIIKPIKLGKIIRNGDVFDSDTVRTRKGQADLLVVDGSVVKMDQNTALYMGFEAMQPAPGTTAPPADRKFRVIAGRIWADVKPSRTSTTKFELPDGVAAVRGTIVEFGVTGAKDWDASVDRGVMSLTQTTANAQMSLSSGDKFGSGRTEGETSRFSNLGNGAFDVLLADGSRVSEFDPTEMIDVTRHPDGTYRLFALRGGFFYTTAAGRRMRISQGGSVESGQAQPGPAGAAPAGHTGGGSGGGPTSNNDMHQPME